MAARWRDEPKMVSLATLWPNMLRELWCSRASGGAGGTSTLSTSAVGGSTICTDACLPAAPAAAGEAAGAAAAARGESPSSSSPASRKLRLSRKVSRNVARSFSSSGLALSAVPCSYSARSVSSSTWPGHAQRSGGDEDSEHREGVRGHFGAGDLARMVWWAAWVAWEELRDELDVVEGAALVRVEHLEDLLNRLGGQLDACAATKWV